MEKDPKDLEIKRLRRELRKKADRIKKFKTGEVYRYLYDQIEQKRKLIYQHLERNNSLRHDIIVGNEKYVRLEAKYKKLQEKFEVNFGFHEYLQDTLTQTADLMENYNALRKQTKTVRQRVPTAEGSRGTL